LAGTVSGKSRLASLSRWTLDRIVSVVDFVDPQRAQHRIPKRITNNAKLFAVIASIATPLCIIAFELARNGLNRDQFDWLFFTGYVAVICGLWLANGQGRRFSDSTHRLAEQGTLVSISANGCDEFICEDKADSLVESIENRGKRSGHRVGVLVALLAMTAFAILHIGRQDGAVLLVGSVALAGPAGYLVGRALMQKVWVFGWWRNPLLSSDRRLAPRPGHVDGAAGLKPLGDFYFSQALVLAVPGVFFLVWTVLFSTSEWAEQQYADYWRAIYDALLLVALLLQITIFFAPMWSAHTAMQEKKRKVAKDAGTTANEIEDIRKKLRGELSPEDRTELSAQLAALNDRYVELDQMPIWPIDTRLRRRFGAQVGLFALPLLSEFITSRY
jgi:hypothetical protein